MRSGYLVALVTLMILLSGSGGYYYFSHADSFGGRTPTGSDVDLANVTYRDAMAGISAEKIWAEQNNVSIDDTQILNLVMQNFETLQNNGTFQNYLKLGGPLSYGLSIAFNFNKSVYGASNNYGMDFTVAYYQFVYRMANNTGVQVWWALNIGENVLVGPVVQYSHNS